MYIQLKRLPTAHKWLLLSSGLLVIFLIYTAIFSTGVLLTLALRQEQWLLHRPLTRLDCVFHQWANFGEVPFSLFFLLLLSGGCLWWGYRRRVVPYLLLLFFLGVGAEILGKHIFPQPVPVSLDTSRVALDCPQIERQPRAIQLLVTLGIWWEANPITAKRILSVQQGERAPLSLNGAIPDYSYPSGHAIRWSFLGLIACWLFARQVRRRHLRRILMAVALAIAFGGGLMQFYVGVHLVTDLVGGYVLGISSACCAIGLLLLNETRKKNNHLQAPVPINGALKEEEIEVS